ncbi:hypothetical protein bcere0025_57740 [Bacillus cereus F65185]|nr:hypothetical protein bcere0025_57740 [Bacillus cereus F65185]
MVLFFLIRFKLLKIYKMERYRAQTINQILEDIKKKYVNIII